MQDITISGATLALFSTILTGILGAMGGLFKLAWAERNRSDAKAEEQYDARYADMKAERDRLLGVAAEADHDVLTALGLVKDGLVALQQTVELAMKGRP